ncbi:MAG: X-Pro dipeptidyl-peptidase-like protein [Frankiales bacterium]|nr:X-Pro dipeptidyl-peptidase-like protein [Frankiales bacterium]
MTLLNRVVSRVLRLPPPTHRGLVRQRDLRATMPDGVVLLADRCFPRGHDADLPTVLIRTPYGRSGLPAFEAGVMAERGYNVVVQSCRGTHGSGGIFEPFVNEQSDGIATVEWVQRQPWFDGRLGTHGSSYCGYTQHALADGTPDGVVGAMAPSVASADLRGLFHPFGVFALESMLSWVYGLDPAGERNLLAVVRQLRRGREVIPRAAASLPVREADVVATGRVQRFFRDWVDHDQRDDAFWDALDHRMGLTRGRAAVTSHAGWFDIFTPYQIADFQAMQAAGRDVELTVGPWNHGGGFGHRVADALALFDRKLKQGARQKRVKPVHVQLHGDDRWLHYDSWPPASIAQRWHVHRGGALGLQPAGDSTPDAWSHDPADPAPSTGGAALGRGGPKDNAEREARDDVLTYTTPPLPSDVAVLGTPRARLHVQSTTEEYDVVVRVCEVDAKGVSRNLSDGVVRLTGAVGPQAVDVELWPLGALLHAGHRIRLQVSSALHPLYARNLGSGEPAAKAVTMVVSRQELFHDGFHQSWIELPIVLVAPQDVVG